MENTEVVMQSGSKKKKIVIWGIIAGVIVLLVGLAVGSFFLVRYINDQPTTYMDENGNEVQTISRNQMAEAYEVGVSYFERGDYELAIHELAKVTEKSSKYEAAQRVREEAVAEYVNVLIEQTTAQLEGKNFDAAAAIAQSGMGLVGDDASRYEKVKSLLDTMKQDMITRLEQAEEESDYATGAACAQTALVFLPEDVQLQTLYIRLSAMDTAQNALAEAEEYIKDDDQQMTFAVLEDALERVMGTPDAVAEITLAYDTYKKDFVNHVEKLARQAKKDLEFAEAEEALSIAAAAFAEDEDVQKLYREISDLNTAYTAINKAEELAQQAEYEELFRIMHTAMDCVERDTEADVLLTKNYETYQKAFKTYLNEQIGEPKTISQFETAIELLETAVELWPKDKEMASRLEDLKDRKPVSVNSMNVIDMKEYRVFHGWQVIDSDDIDDCIRSKISAEDNFGSVYHDASMIICGGHSEYYGATYLTYDCAQYSKLSGVAALWEESKNHAENAYFFVIGMKDDGTQNTLLNKAFPSGTRPQMLDIDVSEYSLVTLGVKAVDEDGEVEQVWPAPIGVILSELAMAK